MNAAVAVRPGTRDDREFARELGRRTAGSSVSAVRAARYDDVRTALERLFDFVFAREHAFLIAADERDEPVGFLLMLFDIPDEVTLTAQAFVAYTAVEPAARRLGAGNALLQAAEALARAHGLAYISLMVTDDNAPARALYDRAGFVTERRMMTKPL